MATLKVSSKQGQEMAAWIAISAIWVFGALALYLICAK